MTPLVPTTGQASEPRPAPGSAVAHRTAAASSADRPPAAGTAGKVEAVLPLSPLQQGMLFHTLAAPGTGRYVVQRHLQLTGPWRLEHMRQAWQQVLARHLVLRSAITYRRRDPLQVVLRQAELPWQVLDWRNLDADRQGEELDRWLLADRRRGFEMSRAPLMRMTWIHTGNGVVEWVWTFHHLLLDGWSVSLVMDEVGALYRALAEGRTLPLEPAPSYRDYLAWVQGQDRDRAERFWRRQLGDFASPTPLPYDLQERATVDGRAGAETQPDEVDLRLDAEQLAGWSAQARRHGLTLNTVALGAWGLLLQQTTGQRDVVLGLVMSSRPPEVRGAARIVGLMLNTLPLRLQLPRSQAVLPWLRQMQGEQVELWQYSSSSLIEIQRASSVPANQALFESLFVFENYPKGMGDPGGADGRGPANGNGNGASNGNGQGHEPLGLEDRSYHERMSYPLAAVFWPGERPTLRLMIDRRRIAPASAQRLAKRWVQLVGTLLDDPQRLLGDFPACDARQRQQAVVTWNQTTTDFPADRSVVTLFQQQVERTPDAPALEFGSTAWSYRDLARGAERLAQRLTALGVEVDDRVVLLLPRSAEAILAQLATLVAGAAYVPLAHDLPEQRLALLLADARPKVVVTLDDQALPVAALEPAPAVLPLTGLLDAPFGPEDDPQPRPEVPSSALAYILYTSGSTGRPKGVAVDHRAITRLVCNTNYLQLRTGDRVAQVATLAFDAATFEIWGPLLHGGVVVGIERAVSLSPQAFATALDHQDIDAMFLTTALFGQLARTIPNALAAVPHLLFGGARADAGAVREVLAHPPSEGKSRGRLINAYGPTECTTFALWHEVATLKPEASNVPIGRPLSNTTTYVVDGIDPVPPGVRGELLLGGPGLARGYFGRPARTAEVFVPHPFATTPGERLYRTGDVVRQDDDGVVTFLDRRDEQVKIRGFRIEPGEVEAHLANHPDLAQAAVLVDRPEDGEPRLVALVSGRESSAPSREVLSDYLRQHLPEYMVPTVFVALDALPLNRNGKIDRAALRPLAREGSQTPAQADRVEPRTATETTLCTLWAEVLKQESVGIDDDFFELGGDSIVLIQILARASAAGLELEAQQVFEHSTVRRLAQLLDSEAGTESAVEEGTVEEGTVEENPAADDTSDSAIPAGRDLRLVDLDDDTLAQLLTTEDFCLQRRPEDDPEAATLDDVRAVYPLSPLQKGMLFHSLREPGTGLYVLQQHWCLRGDLDVEALRRAWGEIIARHEILRTGVLAEAEPEPLAVVVDAVALPWIDEDWRGAWLPRDETHARLDDVLAKDLRQGFDVTQPPLMRLRLIRTGDQVHHLIWTFHHLLLDGWSASLLLHELFERLRTASETLEPERLPSSRPYRDYAAWLSRQDPDHDAKFWRARLAGFDAATPLPFDRGEPAPAPGHDARAVLEVPLDRAILEALEQRAGRHGLTPANLALGAWALLVGDATARHDLVLGVVVSIRPPDLTDSQSRVGLFINTLPLRVHLDPKQATAAWLRQLQENQLGLWKVGSSSLVDIQQWSELPSGAPLFETLFAYENYPQIGRGREAEGEDGPGLEVEELRAEGSMSFPLAAVVWPGEAPCLRLMYRRGRLSAPAVQRLGAAYKTLLTAFARDLDRPLEALPRWSRAARHQALWEWNDVTTDFPRQATLPTLFAEQAARTPFAMALQFDDGRWTYGSLDRQSHDLAQRLRRAGVEREDRVGVVMPRSAAAIVAILAVVRAGAVYVPLDPSLPAERLALIHEDAGLRLAITLAEHQERLPEGLPSLLFGAPPDFDDTPEPPLPEVLPEQLAYVMFTSGSTGRPKGVAISHQAIVRLVRDSNYLQIEPGGTVAQTSNLAFDASTLELWGALLNGAELVGVPQDVVLSAGPLRELLEQRKVETLFLTTAIFNQMAREAPETFGSVHDVLVGGQRLDPAAARASLTSARPPRRLINGYGPTESTTFATWHSVGTVARTDLSIPLGRPLANTGILLLDHALRPVPAGVPAELFIAGDGLARGYFGRPRLTAAAFVPNPFATTHGDRLYRTGDLARYHADGRIDFLGRLDDQVKIRGFRIEPGEIAAALAHHPEVREAAVLAQPRPDDDPRLVAYLASDTALETPDLRTFLAARLPDYMVPAHYVRLDALPLTTNGKVDTRRLPPLEDPAADERSVTAPRDDLERQLCALWEELLEVRPVGIHDSFFDLGGHSLLAVRMAGRVEKDLGHSLPLSELFEADTVERLAERLRAPGRRSKVVVALRAGGGGTPIFCIHPGMGEVLGYRPLARGLDPKRPFYGLRDPFNDGDAVQHVLLEERAQHYLEALRTVQPEGPYVLAGYSFGGVVAYEMARQLEADGQSVALVALLDAGAPSLVREVYRNSDDAQMLAIVATELAPDGDEEPGRRGWFRLGAPMVSKLTQRLRSLNPQERLLRVAARLRRSAFDFPELGPEQIARQVDIFRSRVKSCEGYSAGPLKAPLVFFAARDRSAFKVFHPALRKVDATLGWSRFVGREVETHELPGSHATLLLEPAVDNLAHALDRRIDRALDEVAGHPKAQ